VPENQNTSADPAFPASQSNGPFPAAFQGFVNDPNSVLRDAIAGQDILGFIKISLTAPGVGQGIENIPFLGIPNMDYSAVNAAANPTNAVDTDPAVSITTPNAFVYSAQATFWIEWVRIPFPVAPVGPPDGDLSPRRAAGRALLRPAHLPPTPVLPAGHPALQQHLVAPRHRRHHDPQRRLASPSTTAWPEPGRPGGGAGTVTSKVLLLRQDGQKSCLRREHMMAAKKTDETAADGARAGGTDRVDAAELELARQLAERARTEGMSLTGPGGLLGRLTKVVLEGALEGEMDAHLGYAKHDPAGRDGGNSRNGHRAKTVLTEAGLVHIVRGLVGSSNETLAYLFLPNPRTGCESEWTPTCKIEEDCHAATSKSPRGGIKHDHGRAGHPAAGHRVL
jgi:Transposase, Mutator family